MKKFEVQDENEAKVKFVSAKPYLNIPEEEFKKLILCFRGRKELVIKCDDWVLMDKIKSIIEESNYSFPPMKEIVGFLEKEEIKYYITPYKSTKI